jgi:hypothetical protein
MQITVELPDDISQHTNPGREALERLAIEGYRSGALSHHQAGHCSDCRVLNSTIF